MTNILSPRQLTTKLVDSLPRAPDPAIGNPLYNAPESRQHLLSLHVLFPNELLPALDLLDRGLVTRMYMGSKEHASQLRTTQAQSVATARPPGQSETHYSEATDGHGHVQDDVTGSQNTYKGLGTYQVRSAQQNSSRGGSSRYRNAAYEHTSYYEVRLNAWSCSCPAFAFSAFPANAQDSQTDEREFATQRPSRVGQSDWIFGGLTLGQGMPISCVLVEHSEMFWHCVQERSVSREEMAGWAAGWGD
ncbi:hypothetical protein D0868_14708 [Hortaea werneckii]|uniref:Uncharacterized protein n=1 Tax=Hortaea werneckii TaxID=91943 RepID=A0A3M6XEP0_HORWE|nr:hypothetical protein D0868_14708 [Hortaea werneckii]RMY25253.1 hypothetical protein D0866_11172 [Hortaea werneckii]